MELPRVRLLLSNGPFLPGRILVVISINYATKGDQVQVGFWPPRLRILMRLVLQRPLLNCQEKEDNGDCFAAFCIRQALCDHRSITSTFPRSSGLPRSAKMAVLRLWGPDQFLTLGYGSGARGVHPSLTSFQLLREARNQASDKTLKYHTRHQPPQTQEMSSLHWAHGPLSMHVVYDVFPQRCR